MASEEDAFVVTQARQMALDALSSLAAGALDRVVLTGPEGAGKSALLEHWIGHYDGTATIVLIKADGRNPAAFLRQLGLRLKIDIRPDGTSNLIDAWGAELTSAFVAGEKALLVIDDADQLDPATAETVRMLTGTFGGGNVVLRLIAAGLQDIAPVFAVASREVKSRHLELPNLNLADTQRFLEAVGEAPDIASDVFRATGGNPGKITESLSPPSDGQGGGSGMARKGAPKARLFETPAERKKRLAQTTYDSENPRDFFRWGLGIGEGEQSALPAAAETEEIEYKAPDLDREMVEQHLRATGQITKPGPVVLPSDDGHDTGPDRPLRQVSEAMRRGAPVKNNIAAKPASEPRTERRVPQIDLTEHTVPAASGRGMMAAGLVAFLAVGALAILLIKANAISTVEDVPTIAGPQVVATAQTPASEDDTMPATVQSVANDTVGGDGQTPPKVLADGEVGATEVAVAAEETAPESAPTEGLATDESRAATLTAPSTIEGTGPAALETGQPETPPPMVLAATTPPDTAPGPVSSPPPDSSGQLAPEVFVQAYEASYAGGSASDEPFLAAALSAVPAAGRASPRLAQPALALTDPLPDVSNDQSRTAAMEARPQVQPSEPATATLATGAVALRAATDSNARNLELVRTALKNAPGLGDLAPADLEALTSSLQGGACVDQALREATGKINRHTLAALLRHMNLCPTTVPGSY